MKTTKRIVSAILCVLMIGSVMPFASFAAYENTHTNTGNQIEDLIAVATTQIGYTEGNSTSQQGGTSGGSGNYTKYGAWYGINPGAWCAMFVSWCANQAGIPSSIVYKHASCDYGMKWFKDNNIWQWSPACGGSYTPKRGDIIYFRASGSTTLTDSNHVGIVTSCNGSTVYTIEGNSSNKCQTRSYALTNQRIMGYGTPKYNNTSTGGSTSTGTAGLGTYQITAASLTLRDGPASSYTALAYLSNGAVIDIVETSYNTSTNTWWGKGTYNGITGWISLNPNYSTLTSTYYYITFDPNGGTYPAGQTMVYPIKNNTAYNTAITSIPTATRSGYEFDGWYYNNSYKLTNLADTFTAGADSTFVAKWNAKLGQYTITTNTDPLNMRQGPGSSETVLTQVPKGTVVNITAISGDWGYCSYNGYSGWVSLAYCTYYGAAPSEPETTGTYTLTFDVNGGTMPEGFPTTYQFEYDEYLRDVIPGFPVPTHPTKEFAGWYWDKAGPDSEGYLFNGGWGSQQYKFWNYPVNNDIADATFMAKWVDHSHDYQISASQAATCLIEGYKTYTCNSCGYSYTETIAKLSHNYTSAVTKAPTCTAEGIKTYTCSLCGSDYEETVAKTAHNYTYSAGKVTCSACTVGFTGWFDNIYYAENGNCKKGVFKIGSDFYYAASDYKAAKNSTVLVRSSEKNGLLSDCGDAYYTFDANGRLVTTGFVTGGGERYYYDNTVRATGLKKIENDYYYFDSNGVMAANEWVTITGTIVGVPTAADSRYYFRADGKLLAETSVVARISGGYLYNSDGEILTDGLYFYNGNYYYAYRDGTLAANETIYTYYSNNLLPNGYYGFHSDGRMQSDGWANASIFEGKQRIYFFENFVRAEGLKQINGNYYFFHYNTGEAVFNQTIYCGNPDIGAPFGYYTFGADGICTKTENITPAALASVADGAETPVAFSARVEANTVVSVDTATTVIIATLPVASDDEDDE